MNIEHQNPFEDGGTSLLPPNMKPPFYCNVEGHPNLVRDERTNAILNTNLNEYENYKQLKSIKEEEQNRIETIENNLCSLKSDISEIKDLLKNLLK
jgi:hypothetical protein